MASLERSPGKRAKPVSKAIGWAADARTGRFTHVSREAEKILGYPVDSWLKDPEFWPSHIHPEDREWAISYCKRRSRMLRPYEFEYRMVARNGKVVWLWDAVQVVTRDGKPSELFGVMVDVTQRKQQEESLREQVATWKRVVTQMPEFLLRVAPDGTILFVNRVVPGLAQDSVVGSSLYDYVPITEAGRVKSMIDRAVRTEKPVYYRTVGVGAHQSQAMYAVRVAPVKSAGRVECLTVIAKDITHMEKAKERRRP